MDPGGRPQKSICGVGGTDCPDSLAAGEQVSIRGNRTGSRINREFGTATGTSAGTLLTPTGGGSSTLIVDNGAENQSTIGGTDTGGAPDQTGTSANRSQTGDSAGVDAQGEGGFIRNLAGSVAEGTRQFGERVDDVAFEGGFTTFFLGRVAQDFVFSPVEEIADGISRGDVGAIVLAGTTAFVKPLRAVEKVKKRGPRSVGASKNTAGIVSGNLKQLSDSRLKRLGIDAEKVKADIVPGQGSRFNLNVDQSGSVFLVPVRKGTADPIPVFGALDDLAKDFPINR